ncbi:hypothetical protein DRO61_05525, partial [Candidatus Bathyarchaeota archaeon]
FKERQKILDETNQLGEESFEKQIETIQKLTDEQIDANDLLAESDAIALNEKIRGLELSEIIEGRLLEVIRDRRTAVQDLTDAQIELNQARLDSLRAISESEQNIDQENLSLSVELLQKRLEAEKITAEEIEEINTAIYDVKKEAIIDQADFEKEQAKKDIVEADELAAKLKEIENKKNNDIIRLNQERNDVVNAANKKAAEERIEFLNDSANKILSELEIELDKANQAKKDANNEDIKETQDNIARQQNLAEKGLDNQLAFEQKKLADAEIEKREIEKREQRQKEALQLAEAYLEAYIAELNQPNANPATAGAKALSSTLIAKGIAKTIASFYDGTEDTGTVSGALDANGGRLAVLHDNERVVTKAQNAMIGDMSNDALANLAYDYRTGNLMTDGQLNKSSNNGMVIDNSGLVMEIKGLRKELKEKPVQQVRVDQLGNLIETVYGNGIKTVTKLKNKRRI